MLRDLIEQLSPWSHDQENNEGAHPEASMANRSGVRYRVHRNGRLRILKSPRGILGLSEKNPGRLMADILVRNLSQSGIGFISPEQLYPTELIEISIHHHLIQARVVRCRYLEAQGFEAGAVIQSVRSTE
jgi:hypothetical protein